ncbi:MAG TPA: Fe-S cluster assembly protein SufD [Dongiaceae bacterium]
MPASNRSIALPYADRLAEAAPALPGSDLPWLRDIRAEALARFRRQELPSTRVERWKYTNLHPVAAREFSTELPAPANDRSPLLPGSIEGAVARLVFINGEVVAAASNTGGLPKGVRLLSLPEALAADAEWLRRSLAAAKSEDALAALNLAFMANGVLLRIDDGVTLPGPIEILHVADTRGAAKAFHHRHLVALGNGAAATIVERFSGGAGDPYWAHHHTDIAVGEEAQCRHFKIQDEGAQAFHLAAVNASVARAGGFDSFVLMSGAGLSRHEITVSLDAPEARCRLDGCYLGRGRQHIDSTTDIRHAAPQTTSSETYKGVLDEQAHGVFQGRIVVQPGAQKIDGHQLNKTILLSDRAEMDTKPELEIYADDVKCSHGATVGELDENAVFYLRARGIGLAEARQMLVEGFIEDLIGTVEVPAVRDEFERHIQAWMARSGERIAA